MAISASQAPANLYPALLYCCGRSMGATTSVNVEDRGLEPLTSCMPCRAEPGRVVAYLPRYSGLAVLGRGLQPYQDTASTIRESEYRGVFWSKSEYGRAGPGW